MAVQPTIVIVDDDEETRAMYAALFHTNGWRVRTASDGLEAISIIRTQQPDVVFTGIVMPRMDGFGLVDVMHADPSLAEIPVIINSHYGRPSDLARAERMGVTAVIVRGSMTPHEIVTYVRGICGIGHVYRLMVDPRSIDYARLCEDIRHKCDEPVALRIILAEDHYHRGQVEVVMPPSHHLPHP